MAQPLDFPPVSSYCKCIGGKGNDPRHTFATQTMRKIEQQMNNAISKEIDWKSANTEVQYFSGHDISRVYLHNNLIAEIGPTYVQLFDGGHQSNTTKSRLNAILSAHGIGGERVFQKNYDWFFRMSDGSVIPFFSGMRLN